MLHTYPLTTTDTLNRSGMVLMRAREGAGAPNDLVLRVVMDEGPYLLGEPIPVHVLLINETRESVTIPYGQGHQYAMIWFIIRGPDGKQIYPPISRDIDSSGPGSLTIPSGQQFVHMMDLSRDYAIIKPGQYSVSVEYNSEGKYYEFDRELGKVIARPAWEGGLTADAGTIEVQEPSQRDDREALEKLLEGVMAYPARQRYSILVSGLNNDARRNVINEFPESRYADYARFRVAQESLRRDRWNDRRYAARAMESLQPIDREQYPKLFQEMVLHRLILAHVGAESEPETLRPLVQEFRERFPDSPYELPEAARELEP